MIVHPPGRGICYRSRRRRIFSLLSCRRWCRLRMPGNVNVSTFGKLGFDTVDGKVDAQPLYVAGVSIPGQGAHNVL